MMIIYSYASACENMAVHTNFIFSMWCFIVYKSCFMFSIKSYGDKIYNYIYISYVQAYERLRASSVSPDHAYIATNILIQLFLPYDLSAPNVRTLLVKNKLLNKEAKRLYKRERMQTTPGNQN